eukprot:8226271-Ditylum_brightwellii.AAC.1
MEIIQKQYPEASNEVIYIPKFKLKTSVRKFGDGANRVEAPVISIECTGEDTPYLKTLLSYGYETGQITLGTFVPSRIHLTTGVETYWQQW